MAILPENDPVMVEELCHQLGYDPNMTFDIVPIEEEGVGGDDSTDGKALFKHIFPSPCTVREALTKYLDFSVSNVIYKYT